jgi:glutathione S-transferase
MRNFVVHAVPGSPYWRAVLATLVEKGAGFRLAPVAAAGGRAVR